ncbi:MAG: hypothetical protein QW688_07290 [Thermoprotei archaeon]
MSQDKQEAASREAGSTPANGEGEIALLRRQVEELSGLVKQLAASSQAASRQADKAEHEHHITWRNEGEGFCVDCDTRFSKIKNFGDKLHLLLENNHEGKSFLECPSCRPLFVKSLREAGWDARDDGKTIHIHGRRAK